VNGAQAPTLGPFQVRVSEIREREKKERKIGEAAGVVGEKKERKKETGRVNPTRSFLVKPYPVLRLGWAASSFNPISPCSSRPNPNA
jgi:hypothetical protein